MSSTTIPPADPLNEPFPTLGYRNPLTQYQQLVATMAATLLGATSSSINAITEGEAAAAVSTAERLAFLAQGVIEPSAELNASLVADIEAVEAELATALAGTAAVDTDAVDVDAAEQDDPAVTA